MFDAVVVSDVHCDGPDSPTQVAFLGFLSALRTRKLVLAGDIFHTFWCPGGAPFPAYKPVLDALADFDLVVLPGNHDWALPGALRGTPAADSSAIGTRVRLRLGELDTEVSHGDEVDDSPRYRALHRLLRGAAFGWSLDRLGADGAWSLLHRLAGGLGDGQPSPLLVSRQHALAAERVSQGRQLLVMGHTHQPERRELPGGVFLNPGDWVRHQTWGAVEGDRVTLHRL